MLVGPCGVRLISFRVRFGTREYQNGHGNMVYPDSLLAQALIGEFNISTKITLCIFYYYLNISHIKHQAQYLHQYAVSD